MDPRSSDLLQIRPELNAAVIQAQMSPEERFQNKTLRPVLKFQNELLLAMFRNYIRKHKNHFFELSKEMRLKYIENAIQKDVKFRNALKGAIIGQMTLEEFEEYTSNSSALNKRMMKMVITRLQSQLQLLEQSELV